MCHFWISCRNNCTTWRTKRPLRESYAHWVSFGGETTFLYLSFSNWISNTLLHDEHNVGKENLVNAAWSLGRGSFCVLIGCSSGPLKFLDISLWDCYDTFVHHIFSYVYRRKGDSSRTPIRVYIPLRDFFYAFIHHSAKERRLVPTKGRDPIRVNIPLGDFCDAIVYQSFNLSLPRKGDW